MVCKISIRCVKKSNNNEKHHVFNIMNMIYAAFVKHFNVVNYF